MGYLHCLLTASATGSSSTLLTLVLFGGIVVFGVYCSSNAAQVWRARNAQAPATPGADRLRRAVGRGSAAVALLGLLLLTIAYLIGAASRYQGVLVGHGLFTPRLPDGLEAAEVTEQSTVG